MNTEWAQNVPKDNMRIKYVLIGIANFFVVFSVLTCVQKHTALGSEHVISCIVRLRRVHCVVLASGVTSAF